MGTTRREQKVMKSNRETMGGNVSVRRLLICFGAVLALSLALTANLASARTVYDYKYSGTYFDGSAAGKTFDSGIGQLEYDRQEHTFYVPNSGSGGEPGWVERLAPNGTGVKFSGPNTAYVPMAGTSTNISNPMVSVDQTGGANDGNFYVVGSSAKFEFSPAGVENFAFNDTEGQRCSIAPSYPDGSRVLTSENQPLGAGTLVYFDVETGEVIENFFQGTPGYELGVKKKLPGYMCKFRLDSEGNIYGLKSYGSGGSFSNEFDHHVAKLSSTGLEDYELNQGEDSRGIAIDASNDDVFVLRGENFGSGIAHFEQYDKEGRSLGGGWGGEEGPFEGVFHNSIGIAVDPATHDVWIADKREHEGGSARVEKFEPYNPHVIPDSTATDPVYDDPTGETVKLRGIVNPDGVATTDCHFEYGTTQALGNSIPCEQGGVFTGSSDQVVTAKLSGEKGERFFYKLSVENANEQPAVSNQKYFFFEGLPVQSFLSIDKVNTDGVRMNAKADPNGGNVSVHFEYGEGENYEESSTEETDTQGFSTDPGSYANGDTYEPGVKTFATEVKGLKEGTTYAYRVAVTNEAGTVYSPVRQFTTYVKDSGSDSCSNSQVRQQTEASLLPDCRAYELVSAQNTGGYDVESDTVPGQQPFDSFPDASGRFLYSVHFGLIPGVSGSPTNLGLDPYVATRGSSSWSTRYVGLPADGMADPGSFGSPLYGADAGLRTFAFGGKDICNPCYPDNSTNVPLRLANGSLVKGMAGSLNPAADPAGEVRKAVSDDGAHLIFGSEEKFEEGGKEGSVSIYERNLVANTTQVVSTLPNGSTMGGEVGELDVSADGSRVLIGKVVGEDGAGNKYYDLYMHEGASPNSITVADTENGVIFNGMTSDGSKVFFSTYDALAGDSDTSMDLYRADVGVTDPAPVSRISTGTGGTGNVDACTPVADWNASEGEGKCNVVAFADNAGIASGNGTAYFASPEQLDGTGNGSEAGEPNLYVVEPSGSPHFVGMLDSSVVKPPPGAPVHEIENPNFLTGLTKAGQTAIDQETEEIYVLERPGKVSRYDSEGNPSNFSALASNTISGQELGEASEGQVAVDSAEGSPLKGAFYVTTNSANVKVYDHNGESLGELSSSGQICGVSVDEENGDVYVGKYGSFVAFVYRYSPISKSPLEYSSPEQIITQAGQCNIDAASPEFVYLWPKDGGSVSQYLKSEFTTEFALAGGNAIGTGVHAQTDPTTGDLYINQGNQIKRYDSTGKLIETFGQEALSNSLGVAIRTSDNHVFATTPTGMQEYKTILAGYHPIDNPAILHGLNDAGEHHFEDFQVTPDGRYALFSSPVAITGYQNLNHYELYRYDADTDELICPSCAPTGAPGISDNKLSPYGRNLSDDGRVFFTTKESFTLRDTNDKLDAYEWADGRPQLISTGIGPNDSGSGSRSPRDGKDAFFFTRDTLSPKMRTVWP